MNPSHQSNRKLKIVNCKFQPAPKSPINWILSEAEGS